MAEDTATIPEVANAPAIQSPEDTSSPDQNQEQQTNQTPESAQVTQEAPATPQAPVQDRAAMLYSALSKDPAYAGKIGPSEARFKAGLAKKDVSDAFFSAISKDPDYAPHLPKTADDFYSKINQKDNPAPKVEKTPLDKTMQADNSTLWDRFTSGLKYEGNQAMDGLHEGLDGSLKILQRLRQSPAAYLVGDGFTDEQLDKSTGGGVAALNKLSQSTHMDGDRAEKNSGNAFMNTIGSVLKLVPQMMEPTHIALLSSTYSNGIAAINGSPLGKDMSPGHKVLYATAYSVIQTTILAAGGSKILSGPKALNPYIEKLVMGVFEKLGMKSGVEVSADALAKESLSAGQKFLSVIKRSGTGALQGMLPAGLMMGAAQTATEGQNALTNNITGHNIFKQDLGSAVSHVVNSFTTGLAFGAFTSGVHGLIPKTLDYVDHTSANSTPESHAALHAEIKSKMDQGKIHPEAAIALVDRSQKIKEASTKLPDHLNPEQRTKSAQAMVAVDDAKADLAAEKSKSANVDESFKNAKGETPSEDILRHKVDQMEDRRQEVHMDGKFKYFKDGNGKYFKQFEDQPPIEIEQGRYHYEILSNPESKVTKAPAEQDEKTGQFVAHVDPLVTDEGAKVGEVKETVQGKVKRPSQSNSNPNAKPAPAPEKAPEAPIPEKEATPVAENPTKKEEPVEAPKTAVNQGKYSSENEEGRNRASNLLESDINNRFVKEIKSLSLTDLKDLSEHEALYRNIYSRDFKHKTIIDEIKSRNGQDGPGQEPILRKGDLVKDDVVTYKDKQTGVTKRGVIRKVFNGPDPEYRVLHKGGKEATIKGKEIINANGREFNPKNEVSKTKAPEPVKEAPKAPEAPEKAEPKAEEPKSAPQSKELAKGDKVKYKDAKGVEREGNVVSRTEGEKKTHYSVKDAEGNRRNVSPENISEANGKAHTEKDLIKEKLANDLRANPKEVKEEYDPELVKKSEKKLNDTKKPCA